MINTINEAINRKLASISFTTIVKGTVESLNPLKIRINNRIVIGTDFIEPKSLGLDDYSPGQFLPLIIGEKLELVQYNNGQRFYILGKSVSTSTSITNYDDLQNKPKLNTDNSTSQPIVSDEEIEDTINLHKISKTGKYNDLLERPIIDYKVQDYLKDVLGVGINKFNGRVKSLNFSHDENRYATYRVDLATSFIIDNNEKPPHDGYVHTYFWDNDQPSDSQLFIPNNIRARLAFRTCIYDNGFKWSDWNEIPKLSEVLLYDVIDTW